MRAGHVTSRADGLTYARAPSLAASSSRCGRARGLGAGGAVEFARLLPGLEQDSVNQRFERRGAQPAPGLLVVAIDDKTFDELSCSGRSRARATLRRSTACAATAPARSSTTSSSPSRPSRARTTRSSTLSGARATSCWRRPRPTSTATRNVLGGDEHLAALGAHAGASNLPAGPGWRAAALRSVGRGPRDTGHGRRPPRRSRARAERLRRRGRLDRLPRPARHDRHRLVLRPRQRSRRSRARARADRRRRGVCGDAAGRPPDADRLGRADVGPRDRGQRDLHGHARAADARRAALGRPAGHPRARRCCPALASLRLRALLAALLARRRGRRLARRRPGRLRLTATCSPVAAPLFALALGTVATIAAGYLAERRPRRRFAARNEALEEARPRAHRRAARDAAGDHPAPGRARPSRATRRPALHLERIGLLCERVGLALGLTAAEAETLRHASLLHDVGKIAVPDAILTKPGKLTDEEWVVMRRHADGGRRHPRGLARADHAHGRGRSPSPTTSAGTAPATRRAWPARRSRSWGGSARCATSSTPCSHRGPTRSRGPCRTPSTSCAASAAALRSRRRRCLHDHGRRPRSAAAGGPPGARNVRLVR